MNTNEIIKKLYSGSDENIKKSLELEIERLYEKETQNELTELIEELDKDNQKLFYETKKIFFWSPKTSQPHIVCWDDIILINHFKPNFEMYDNCAKIAEAGAKLSGKHQEKLTIKTIFGDTIEIVGGNLDVWMQSIYKKNQNVLVGFSKENKKRYNKIMAPYYRKKLQLRGLDFSNKSKKLIMFYCIFPYTAMFGFQHFYLGHKKDIAKSIVSILLFLLSVLYLPLLILTGIFICYMWGYGIYQAVLASRFQLRDSKGNYIVEKNMRN